ncbi:hypothetical protein DN585_13715 [Intrasporangium calvum]|nr:hypothetical protein DN585_13715 [Intrasporangium calvum]
MVEPIRDHDRRLEPRPLLTPESSAIAALALAVLGLRGQGAWTTALNAFLPDGFAPNEFAWFVVGAGLGSLAVAVGAWWLAPTVLIKDAIQAPSWAEHLARAAVLISMIAAVLSALTIVGGLRGLPL